MKLAQKLIIALGLLGSAILATPAEAHECYPYHHWHRHYYSYGCYHAHHYYYSFYHCHPHYHCYHHYHCWR